MIVLSGPVHNHYGTRSRKMKANLVLNKVIERILTTSLTSVELVKACVFLGMFKTFIRLAESRSSAINKIVKV